MLSTGKSLSSGGVCGGSRPPRSRISTSESAKSSCFFHREVGQSPFILWRGQGTINDVKFMPQLIISVGFGGPRLPFYDRYIRNIGNRSWDCIIGGIYSLNQKRHVLAETQKEKEDGQKGGPTDATVNAHTQQWWNGDVKQEIRERETRVEWAGCSPQNVSRAIVETRSALRCLSVAMIRSPRVGCSEQVTGRRPSAVERTGTDGGRPVTRSRENGTSLALLNRKTANYTRLARKICNPVLRAI